MGKSRPAETRGSKMRRDGLRSGGTQVRRRVLSIVLGACACVAVVALAASPATARVLTVGTFNGKRGGFRTIQKAVEKALPGDWVLVGPGDYKEAGANAPAGSEPGAGVLVTKPGV